VIPNALYETSNESTTTCDATRAYAPLIIAFSLGYATPRCAANILKDAHEGQPNYSEWIYSCYRADPRPAVRDAIKARHALNGYMSDYELALRIVRRAAGGANAETEISRGDFPQCHSGPPNTLEAQPSTAGVDLEWICTELNAIVPSML
jgi:hypothetical protein